MTQANLLRLKPREPPRKPDYARIVRDTANEISTAYGNVKEPSALAELLCAPIALGALKWDTTQIVRHHGAETGRRIDLFLHALAIWTLTCLENVGAEPEMVADAAPPLAPHTVSTGALIPDRRPAGADPTQGPLYRVPLHLLQGRADESRHGRYHPHQARRITSDVFICLRVHLHDAGYEVQIQTNLLRRNEDGRVNPGALPLPDTLLHPDKGIPLLVSIEKLLSLSLELVQGFQSTLSPSRFLGSLKLLRQP